MQNFKIIIYYYTAKLREALFADKETNVSLLTLWFRS